MSDSTPTHPDHQTFLDALASKSKLSVRYFHKKEKRELVQICAALDFGPLRGADEKLEHYQFWDLEAKKKPKNRAVLPSDVVSMTRIEGSFEPAEIITWTFKPGAWRIARDWGEFS